MIKNKKASITKMTKYELLDILENKCDECILLYDNYTKLLNFIMTVDIHTMQFLNFKKSVLKISEKHLENLINLNNTRGKPLQRHRWGRTYTKKEEASE